MAGIYDVASLRRLAEANGFQGNDEQLILETARREKRDPADLARYLGYDLGGKWGNRASAAIDSYQANMYGLGEAVTGADWFRSGRRANEAASGLQREIARSQGAISSYKDVGGVGDALDYVGGLAVDSAPYLAEALVGGLAVRGLSTGLRGIAQAGRTADASVDAVRAGQAADAALTQRSLLGGAAASYPSAVGDILSNQRDASADGDTMDLGAALIGGVPYAAANMFGLEGLAARGSLGRGLAGLDTASAAKRIAGNVGMTAGVEGLSETFQEGINQGFGRMATNPNERMFSPEAMERYGESFVGGAALGGLMGAPGANRRSQGYYDREQMQGAVDRQWQAQELAEQKRGLDLLNAHRERTSEEIGGLRLGYDPNPNMRFVMPDGSLVEGDDARAMAANGATQEGLDALAQTQRDSAIGEQNFRGQGDLFGSFGTQGTGWAPAPEPTAATPYGVPPEQGQLFDPAEEARRQAEAIAVEKQKSNAARQDAYQTFGVQATEQRQYVNRSGVIPLLASIREHVAAGRLDQEHANQIIGRLSSAVENNDLTDIKRVRTELKPLSQPGVPGPTGVTGSPVASPSNQPGGSPGAERPVGAPAAPPVVPGANMAGTSGGTNTGVSAPGRDGDGRNPAELRIGRDLTPEELAVAQPRTVRTDWGKGEVEETSAPAPKGVETPEQTTFRKSYAERAATLSPEDADLLERWTGVKVSNNGELAFNDDGSHESYRDIAPTLYNSKTKRLGVSPEIVRERVKAALIRAGADADISPKLLWEKLGYDVEGLDAETLQRFTDNATSDTDARETVDETTGEVTATGIDQTSLDYRGDAASTDDGADSPAPAGLDAVADATDAVDLESLLYDELASGDLTQTDIAEASVFYGIYRPTNGVRWDQLTVFRQAEVVLAYAKAADQYAEGSLSDAETAAIVKTKAAYEQRNKSRLGPRTDERSARGVSSGTEGDTQPRPGPVRGDESTRPSGSKVPEDSGSEQPVIGTAQNFQGAVTRKPKLNREVLDAAPPAEAPKRAPGKLSLKPKLSKAPADYSKYAGLTTAPEEIAIVDGPSVTIGGADAVQTLTAMDQKESALEAILTCVKRGA